MCSTFAHCRVCASRPNPNWPTWPKNHKQSGDETTLMWTDVLLIFRVIRRIDLKMAWPSIINVFCGFILMTIGFVHLQSAQYKRFEYKYSFKGPYIVLKDNSVPFWDVGGRKMLILTSECPQFGINIFILSRCNCQWWPDSSGALAQGTKR